MRNRKIIAFITSLTMLFGCQSVLVSAEEITDTQPGISQKDEQNPRENPELKSMVEVTMEYTGCTEDEAWDAVIKEWDLDNIKEFGNSFNKISKHLEDLGYEVSYLDETPLEDSENTRVKGMIDGMEYYDIIEINGRTYYDMGSAYYSGDELISLSATDAVARPGTRTYVDISFDGPADLNAFLIQLTYDKNALKLISASVKEEFNEVSDEAEYEDEDEKWDTFMYNPEEAILFYFRRDLTPIDLSDENTVRLCFEVSADAEEKNYEISIEKADKGGLTGLQRIEYYNDYYYAISYVPGSFSSGSVTVSKTEQPKTNLMPKPLSRVYADLGTDTSVITGDVNEDGKINVADMITIKSEVLSGEEYSSNSDITEDGSVNAADILALKKYLLS